MYDIHTTREGKQMMISQMEDRHLLNLIKLELNQITLMLDASSSKLQLTPAQQILYNLQSDEIAKRAREEVPRKVRHLYPYIAEAMLRGLTEVTENLQLTFGRKTKDTIALDIALPTKRISRARTIRERLEDAENKACYYFDPPNDD